MTSAFPKWLRNVWLGLCPFGLAWALRITWEKTFLTRQHGPQMVGFSLMHRYPIAAVAGILCCFFMVLWLGVGGIYAIKHRRYISRVDAAMLATSLFISLALMVPDTFFAAQR